MDIIQFLWKNIVYRFEIPQSIVTDNGPQFDSKVYRNFCHELKIRNLYSTPWYPQSNGQAEASNKTLLMALKKRVYLAKGKWVEELPGVLWAYRTISRNPTGILPFALAYEMEAIILTKIGIPTLRTKILEKATAETITKDLDMTDELREAAAVCIASYQQRLTNLYNRHVKPYAFRAGDLVLRRVFENTADPTTGKFQPNWEGPYVIVRVGLAGSYARASWTLASLSSISAFVSPAATTANQASYTSSLSPSLSLSTLSAFLARALASHSQCLDRALALTRASSKAWCLETAD